MTGVMPSASTLLRSVLPVLVFASLAAPAHAWQPPVPARTGGVQLQDLPPAIGSVPAPDADTLDDLLDLLPPVVPVPVPAPLPLPLPPVTTTMVPGTVARLRTDGRAAIPRGAPKRVRRLIAQYNKIVGMRYLWGGGHALVDDKAYDCSGAVGYGFIKTGMLHTTMVSGDFARWAAAGQGRWVTVYANRTHVYTEIAGLRLDTSPYGDPYGGSGVRWRPLVGVRDGFKMRHPVGL
ncbi:MAG: hypothetical protein QOD69_2089 [Solirubrobacteraceae bacterium]|jgi:hypothetical protein|nr:hypothetical protein [Solirubrobacteraceae bacterium]